MGLRERSEGGRELRCGDGRGAQLELLQYGGSRGRIPGGLPDAPRGGRGWCAGLRLLRPFPRRLSCTDFFCPPEAAAWTRLEMR